MNSGNRRPLVRFWQGVICAFFASWLAFALIVAVSILVSNRLQHPLSIAFFVAWCLASLLLTLFAAGLICAFLWHPVAGAQTRRNWGAWFMLIVLAPLLIAEPLAILVLIFLYALLLIPFLGGLERGEEWWPRRPWRHLFGLANPWEREENER